MAVGCRKDACLVAVVDAILRWREISDRGVEKAMLAFECFSTLVESLFFVASLDEGSRGSFFCLAGCFNEGIQLCNAS